ncbi:MAG: metalloregulator ArsR/SmtB family transcription factor [Myxococcota bacterium]
METTQAVTALAALAQETRLDVFRLLVEAGPDGLAAGEISEHLEIPSATLSFHLKELRAAGLVACERVGRSRIYRPEFAEMQRLLDFLTRDCCGGVPRRRSARGR